MRFKRTAQATAVAATLTLGLSACGGGSSKTSGPDAILSADGCEPQQGLVTTNTTENCGGRVLDLISEGLYTYGDNGALVDAKVQSWTTTDNQNITVKIKPGDKFDDGSAVTAKNYVDAWNFGASAKNAQGATDFFQDIEGYDANNKTQTTLSGLKVVDDNTFTIKLKHPVADFKQRMGYVAFRPLPEKAIQDPKSFGENPIGNGPYKMSGQGAWQHNTSIDLVKSDTYTGTDKPANGGISFKIYQSADAAYSDAQADNLDVLYQVPPAQLKSYQSDFKDRFVNTPYAGNAQIGVPTYIDHFHQDQEGKLRRQAIAMAINRDELMSKIFNGSKDASQQFVPSSIPGYNKDVAGSTNANYDPAKAKQLWAQADAISPYGSGTFTIAYNNDGGHKEWVDAVANQLKNNLGINAEGKPYPDFKSFLTDRDNKKLTGAFRQSWQADYPSIYNFIQPMFQTNASNNASQYTNTAFDAKLNEAQTATSDTDRYNKLNEAQSMLLDDMAAIPLYDYKGQSVWSNNVQSVKLAWNGLPMYSQIAAKS
ncbi:MAG: ABC transporter substrate-binding protein [Micrococcaceae bacterium]